MPCDNNSLTTKHKTPTTAYQSNISLLLGGYSSKAKTDDDDDDDDDNGRI